MKSEEKVTICLHYCFYILKWWKEKCTKCFIKV